MLTKEDYMKLPKERLAELLEERELSVTHVPEAPHHIIDANKKVDRVIGTADHIKTALDVLNKKGDEK